MRFARGFAATGSPAWRKTCDASAVEAQMSRSITSATRGLLAGAALMYFFDPARGRRRRARVVDLAAHVRRVEGELLGKALRDAEHRARGLVERISHLGSDAPSDGVLEGRVRAALGRAISHPGAVGVDVRDRVVALRGPVLEAEAEAAVRCAEHTRGVVRVVDQLERHATADRIPALQGTRPPTR